jgi:VanZ family protein
MKKFLKYWGPAILWMGIIFTFSAIPNLKTDLEQDFLLRKIAHMVEFAILTFLLYRALSEDKSAQGRSASGGKKLALSFILALLYAFSDEFHQLFVRGRHCSLWDVAIDSIGILIFSIACYYKNRKKVDN